MCRSDLKQVISATSLKSYIFLQLKEKLWLTLGFVQSRAEMS